MNITIQIYSTDSISISTISRQIRGNLCCGNLARVFQLHIVNNISTRSLIFSIYKTIKIFNKSLKEKKNYA